MRLTKTIESKKGHTCGEGIWSLVQQPRINKETKQLNIVLHFGLAVQSRVDLHEQSPLGERLLQE